jgi:hypothetical protein
MPLYQVAKDKLESVNNTTFAAEGMMERQDLQRLLKADISPLGNDLMVIAEEYGNWEDSKRRIDLLCLDKQARLVVVEIKRTDDGGHMELQAIRYAAMVSSMTMEQAVAAHAKMLGGQASDETARQNILDFLGIESIDEMEFDGDVRIILVAANFSTEITTSVMWLNKYELDITCVRLLPYKVNGQVLIDITQIIPLPEAADYEVKVRAQAQEAKKVKSVRGEIIKRFWAQLIENSIPATTLLANRSTTTDHWLSAGIGKSGFTLTLSLTEDRARVECYIKFGQNNERAMAAFNALAARKSEIETAFGDELDWQDLPGKFGCRICKDLQGGWRTPEENWPKLQQVMIETLIRLEKALRGPVQSLNV